MPAGVSATSVAGCGGVTDIAIVTLSNGDLYVYSTLTSAYQFVGVTLNNTWIKINYTLPGAATVKQVAAFGGGSYDARMAIVLSSDGKLYAVGTPIAGASAYDIPTTGTWTSPAQIGTASNCTQVTTTGGNFGTSYAGFTAINTSNELWGAGINLIMGNFHKIADGFISPLISSYPGTFGLGLKTDGLYYYSTSSLGGTGTFAKVGYASAGVTENPTFNPGVLFSAFQYNGNSTLALIP
jgi:hypothetical protein